MSRLWIVTTRPIHAEEVINGARTRSTDHPFGVAHIHIDGTQAVEGEGRVSEVRKTK